MSTFDPHRSWLALEVRAGREPSERRRGLLLKVRDHMEFEIKGELEALMATLTAEPVYHFRGSAPSVLSGRAQVSDFYRAMIDRGGQQFEVELDRILVDDDAVVTEGRVKQVHRGAAVRAMGLDELAGEPVADDDLILATTHLITLWPADAEGLLVGEDIYFGEDPFANLEKIRRADLPSYYVL